MVPLIRCGRLGSMSLTSAEKSARYRAKDVDAYRAKKAAFARTPEQRAIRAARMKKWRAQNPERANAHARAATARLTPEERQRRKEWSKEYWKRTRVERRKCQRAWEKANPSKVRNSYYKTNYGISLADYDALLLSQSGGCAICCAAKGSKTMRLAVDHCHTTEKVRGLLCVRCNVMLGWYERHRPKIEPYLTGTAPK